MALRKVFTIFCDAAFMINPCKEFRTQPPTYKAARIRAEI
jgi:hypothetical protein